MGREIRRGDIYYANLPFGLGSEQGGSRPTLIIQNDTGNKHSGTVVAALITSKAAQKKKLPTHCPIRAQQGLGRNSLVLLEQIRVIDKSRLSAYLGTLSKACTPHYIEEDDICAFVLNDIRLHARLAASEREQLAARLLASMKKANNEGASAIQSKIRESETRLAVIASSLKSLYEDKCAGKIPESVFLSLMGDFAKEQSTLEERLPQLRKELDGIQEVAGEIEDWLALISSYLELKILDRATVMGLIESITVSERVKKYGRQTQEIEIEYRFLGNLMRNAKEDIA